MSNRNSAPCVNVKSVPRCLRHTMPCAVLEEAAWVAEFLGAACEALLTSDEPVSSEAAAGFRLCNDLLLDKLAIASGNLPFPLTDVFSKTEAVLWKPDGEQDGEHE